MRAGYSLVIVSSKFKRMLAVVVVAASILLNLDETITKE